ncbi:hypothetical protein DY000_02054036 [Brassica cretica]|uniref:Uncharacterized protein n=1 Tax=Brassica cretica TaxID=69181 RepID=A0ABQ7AD71_BRACR|nr:hypothetical protein DY000_02054036 [Brassica cretica]
MGKEVTAASYICSHGVESTEHHSAFFYAAADRSIGEKNRDPIFEAELWAVFLDAGKAPGRRRGVLLHVFCFVLLYSRLLVVFSYWFCLLAVSYDSCPMIPLGASHTRSVRLLVPAKSTLRENLLTSSAKPRLCPLRLLLLRLYPKVYQRYPSTRFTSPIECGEADPFPENNVGEILLNKNLICSLLRNSWALVMLHLLGHSSILRGSTALRFYWIFISKLRRFRLFLLSVFFEIHIVSSESFLGGFSCRRLKPQFQGFFRQHPLTLPAIMLDSASNSPMESEVKRVSTAVSFRLQIFLLPGPFGIHLVSQDNIDGCRASLFRLTGYLASIGFPSLFQSLSLGHFSVFSDYLKLFRVVVSRIQVKIIRGSLYFELVFPCSTSIHVLLLYCFCCLSLPIPLSIPFTRVFQRLFRLFEALPSCGFKDSSEDYLRISLL